MEEGGLLNKVRGKKEGNCRCFQNYSDMLTIAEELLLFQNE